MDTTKEREFLDGIDALTNGERAALRHSCGMTLAQADGSALMAFYRKLPRDVHQKSEEGWFMGACLRCMWKPDEAMQILMEEALRKMQSQSDSSSVEKRLIALLDTPLDEDGFFARKLWRMTKQLKQKGYVVDCAALIWDVCRWNQPKRYIQMKWARVFQEAEMPTYTQDTEREGEE